jgi:hypothetical protein
MGQLLEALFGVFLAASVSLASWRGAKVITLPGRLFGIGAEKFRGFRRSAPRSKAGNGKHDKLFSEEIGDLIADPQCEGWPVDPLCQAGSGNADALIRNKSRRQRPCFEAPRAP